MKYKYSRKQIVNELVRLYPSPCKVRDVALKLLTTKETKPAKIEKLEVPNYSVVEIATSWFTQDFLVLARKINEIIDYLNSKEDK